MLDENSTLSEKITPICILELKLYNVCKPNFEFLLKVAFKIKILL